jgi:hypothetical protein
MSDDARALRAALEDAQARLKAARAGAAELEARVRERRLLRARVQRAQSELAQLQLRERELLDALLEAKRLVGPLGGLDHQLRLLQAEERSRFRLGERWVVLIATAVPVLGLAWLALSNADVIDHGVVGGTMLVVAAIGAAMYFIGPTRPP